MTTMIDSPAEAGSSMDLAAVWQRDWLLGRRWFLGLLLLSWFAISLGGMALIWRYETTAADPTEPPPRWPAHSALEPSASKQTLVLFAHPKCPCTRASLEVIADIALRHQNTVATQVVFFQPQLSDDSWSQTELCRSAQANPVWQVVLDHGGKEVERFGVTTSGHAVLYDRDGTLLFSGGVTAARGKAGANANQAKLLGLLGSAEESDRTSTDVYGCPLLTPTGGTSRQEAVCPLP
jgi:hypothetical protein